MTTNGLREVLMVAARPRRVLLAGVTRAVVLCPGDGTVSVSLRVRRTTVRRMWPESLWESGAAVYL